MLFLGLFGSLRLKKDFVILTLSSQEQEYYESPYLRVVDVFPFAFFSR